MFDTLSFISGMRNFTKNPLFTAGVKLLGENGPFEKASVNEGYD